MVPRLNNYEGKNKMKSFENYVDWVEHENKLARSNLDWVKKLGQWHLSGGNGQTLCGVLMLGNNYAKYIPENERTKCSKCFE